MENTLLNKNNISYNGIDLAKFIAAFFIIALHCSPLESFGEMLNLTFVSTICRYAVPFFFACSGFFFFKGLSYENGKIAKNKENKDKLLKYTFRLSFLYVGWSAIYLCYQIPDWIRTGWFSVNAFVDYGIAFLKSGSYYHLWYVLSLIYATIICYLLLTLVKTKVAVFISLFLYILGMFTYSYSWLPIPGIEMLNNISSITGAVWIALTRALPLMLIGFYIGTLKFRLSQIQNLVLFMLSSLGLCVEFYLLCFYTPNEANFSYVMFTIPCEIFLFKLIQNINVAGNKNTFVFLRNSSTVIYCVHPLIINLYSLIPGYTSINSVLKYLCVVIVAFVVSLILIKISRIKKLNILKYLY